jgi:predicted RNA binding protein YcfA (HicA-like mRNA interferase family)
MSKVPGDLSYKRVVRALQRDGWVVARQGKHCILRKRVDDVTQWLVVPRHKPLKRSTLAHLLKDARIDLELFLTLL